MTKLVRIACAFLLLFTTGAHAQNPLPAEKKLGGSMEAVVGGKKIVFAALKTDIEANLEGDLATIQVTQTFANPSKEALNATYLFPLHQDAAVYRMVMQTGDEVIEAQIQKIEDARKTFEDAKHEGKAAALLTEHRPNMFTQEVANLMPERAVKVTISYVQTVPKRDGAYELAIPLIVGPRYQPRGAGVPPSPTAKVSADGTFGSWELENLPAYPPVAGLTIPDTIEKERVSIRVHLHAGMPVQAIGSSTHPLQVADTAENDKVLTLKEGRTIDNRDFVLHYELAAEGSAQAGLLAHKDARGGFFSLMLEPPAMPQAHDIHPREMVFVLDTSGSMDGEPVNASKAFMRHALNALRPQDYFRIIRFSNNASEFTSGPVAATPENIQAGQKYVDSLTADGGTEAATAINQAFSIAPQPNTLRIVVFLTDGYIGNEAEILGAIHEKIGSARIYALGVGTSVNRYLLEEMARAGKGFARFIDPTEKADDAAIQLAGKLETPVLTDISIDWGDLSPSDVVPAVVPDLFAGGNIRIQGRYNRSGKHTITVHGMLNGRKARMPVTIDLPASSNATSEAIPLIWARAQIAETMRSLTTPEQLRSGGKGDDELKALVTQLGLDYTLVTRWTSFVAVSKKVVNEHPEQAMDTDVPLPMVKGVTGKAYGERPMQTAFSHTLITTAENYTGSATPEPATWCGMFLIGALGLLVMRRRQRA